MSLGLSQSLRLDQRLTLSLPSTNWSLLDAFRDQGDTPLQFNKIQLDVSEMSLEERLKAVDDANEVFRFEYGQEEDRLNDLKGGFFKVPLLRDSTIEPDNIKIKIKRSEYLMAKAILNGAGRFQRIARSVPYLQLYKDVKEFVENQGSGSTLEETVIVGVDRGGRLPSFVMREALGKDISYTLKINQANGINGNLDIEKFNEFIDKGLFKDKFVLFVDSTVDSGRQIQVLTRYFDSNEFKSKIGHKGWGIVGSNDCGQSFDKHRNINWGLDPDESFEDNPQLMGVDYVPGCNTRVYDCPSETSEAIKKALLEVPKGIVLDLSGLDELMRINDAYPVIKKIVKSKTWDQALRNPPRKNLGVSGLEAKALEYDHTKPRKRLLVIGDGNSVTLSKDDADYIATSLANRFNAIAGIESGNPGLVLKLFNKLRSGSSQLYQPVYTVEDFYGDNLEMFGNSIRFDGDNKEDFRENLVSNADAVLVLGGKEGTLNESVLSLYANKPVYVIRNFGAVGKYLNKSKLLKRNSNLHLCNDALDLVSRLEEI